ncbi:MAG: hypothetical protein WBV82_18775 [Myxococcaceae bacterium]
MEGAANGLPPERLILAFEQALDSLWRRAHQPLGEVTLAAIVDRVLYTAAEQYPILAPLKIDANGLRWQELRERAANMHDEQLTDAIRFVLVEFLTVLGNLTAEILTPSLHAALSAVTPEINRDEKMSQRDRRGPPSLGGEDAKS